MKRCAREIFPDKNIFVFCSKLQAWPFHAPAGDLIQRPALSRAVSERLSFFVTYGRIRENRNFYSNLMHRMV